MISSKQHVRNSIYILYSEENLLPLNCTPHLNYTASLRPTLRTIFALNYLSHDPPVSSHLLSYFTNG